MIALRDVNFSYSGHKILHDFCWQVPETGVTCVFGPSGCGKSTLLRLLAGLEAPQSGTVERPARVSYLFQDNRLLPWQTALDNLKNICDEQTARQWLARVELTEDAGQRPAALSGGMQRRVALARALAFPAPLLLLDEPFTGMDPALRQRLYPLIRSQNRPVLLVTHERQDIDALGDRVFSATGVPLVLNLES